jgi:hypothetical protein
LLIPAAYRSLSRPSSPLRAKASPVYPFLLSSTHYAFARNGMLFYLRVVCLSVHWFIASLVLLPLYFCSCNPLKPDNVPTVVFSFFQLLLPICQRTLPHTIIIIVSCIISYPFQETEGTVENNGFEPLTPCVQGRCSSQLS